MEKSERVSVRIPISICGYLDTIAKARQCNRSDVIRDILQECMREYMRETK